MSSASIDLCAIVAQARVYGTCSSGLIAQMMCSPHLMGFNCMLPIIIVMYHLFLKSRSLFELPYLEYITGKRSKKSHSSAEGA